MLDQSLDQWIHGPRRRLDDGELAALGRLYLADATEAACSQSVRAWKTATALLKARRDGPATSQERRSAGPGKDPTL